MEQVDNTAVYNFNDELTLLIQSKYQIIYVECAEEEYALRQFKEIAGRLRLIYYYWSVTEGLQRDDNAGGYYQTTDPVKMIQTAIALSKAEQCGPGLYVLKDFHQYLDNPTTIRILKDFLAQVRKKQDTIIILAPVYKLPVDLEPYAAHIIGGYPGEDEIGLQMAQILEELTRYNKGLTVTMTEEETTSFIHALKGLSVQQIRNAVTKALMEDKVLNFNDLETVETFKRGLFNREGLLEFCGTKQADEIAGFEHLKGWLAERRGSYAEKTDNSLPPPKGIMLLGVQGCGKSLAVKVIAKVLNLPLYRLDMGRLYSKFLGESEENLRKSLTILDRLSPVCLWIDEIEKGFSVSDGSADGGVSQRLLGTFLTWMQERKTPCFVAATANAVYQLPPEFLRKGRFDEIFFVDLPDTSAREGIFRIHLRKRGFDPENFDLKVLVEKTPEFSGAEIEQVIIAALYSAANKQTQLTMADLTEKIALTKPLAVLKSEEITALREWAGERTISA